MIFNVSGGGGAALNFKVLAYATEEELLAATPAENTIGIVTTAPITSWIFSSEEPSPLTPGMVWISTSSSSSAAFNALKKNNVMVYPISAKQVVSGELVHVIAKSRQGGEWVDWISYIYAYGTEYYQCSSSNPTYITAINTDTYLQITSTIGSIYAPIIYWPDIDLRNVSTIAVKLTNVTVDKNDRERYIGIGTTTPNANTNPQTSGFFEASIQYDNTAEEQTVYLDVSNEDFNGFFNVYFVLGGNSSARIVEITLIP